MDALVGATMTARRDNAARATAADYGFTPPASPLRVLWVACASGQFGPSDFPPHPGAWIVQSPDHALLIGLADSTILAASPLPATASAPPSFACAAASSASEHAICASPDLAAAYDEARQWCDNDAGKLRALAAVQNAWRQQRDRCSADAACLTGSMAAQTRKLGMPGVLGRLMKTKTWRAHRMR